MSAGALLPLISISNYGVLGTQLSAEKKTVQAAPEPDAEMVIVDPAGLPYVQVHGPSKAGGASGAIYEWLGIKSDLAFPDPVKEAIKAPGQAKYHQYGERHVIHVVGPNLNAVYGTDASVVDKVIGLLAQAYANTFSEVGICAAKRIRLLPVSGGIFAGRFADDIPWMTIAALDKGFTSLPADTQESLTQLFSENKLEVCVFGADSLPAYEAAFASGGAPPEDGPQFLNKLWIGALAEISGLTSEKAMQYNGTICTVLQTKSKDGKYLVQLMSGGKAPLPIDNLELAKGGALVPGAKVTVNGLRADKAKKHTASEVEGVWQALCDIDVYPDFASDDSGGTISKGTRVRVETLRIDGTSHYGFISTPIRGWIPVGPKPWNVWTEKVVQAELKLWLQDHLKWGAILDNGTKQLIPAPNLRIFDSDQIDMASEEWIDLF